MKISTIAEELNSLNYHGRGIMLGKSADGKKAVAVYFIMGRSENSRNRIFVEEGDALKTQAFDDSKMTDPHLIIYYPVRVMGNKTIVTNGDQTDTIFELMNRQMTFEQALRTREFEDDKPIFTPRISGIIRLEGDDMNFAMSVIKSAEGDDSSCERFSFAYFNPLPGRMKFVHTYNGTGTPLPSYEGEPKTLELPDIGIDELTELVWKNLNEDNKVSLFVRYIDIKSGKSETRVVNKNA
ncbi:MAG: IMP cyclohydrolase [Clostridiales bacterium]|nr:IMP cyclohydrolase [Clostridiales bacterium]MCD7827035.1 IMP cyclohydrolase [Clostridiales bacterium]